MPLLWPRIVLKLSGEALMGPLSHGFHSESLTRIAQDIVATAALGCQIGVVVGGGNFFRGIQAGPQALMERPRADQIGMLATVMNGLALERAIANAGAPARLLSAWAMPQLCETYTRSSAIRYLEAGQVVIMAGGTGNPLFTTDTGAVLRAVELQAGAMLKATQVDGIYTADPKKDPNATRYEHLSHQEALEKNLGVMDQTAFSLARENGLPILVFSIQSPFAVRDAILGQARATRVEP